MSTQDRSLRRYPPAPRRIRPFGGLRQYEADTWYDAAGRISFTASKGLPGIGLPRRAIRGDTAWTLRRHGAGGESHMALGWEDVCGIRDGVITRRITDDTLPGGPRQREIEYHHRRHAARRPPAARDRVPPTLRPLRPRGGLPHGMGSLRALDVPERARPAMTAESTTWNIERVWTATTEDTTEQLRTLELSRFRGLIMLGTAGSGKTTEAARLANQERASGASVQECRLAEFADTSTELAEHLRSLSEGADEKTVFYLDALDEAMIPARRRWLAIKRWVTDHLGDTAASIRITCRSAVWPSELTRVIADFAGNQASATALLHPLSDDDILSVAASHHIDPVAFLDRIRISGARSLAGQPLLLRMLLQLHQSRHGLPASQKDLFQKGLELLLSDPEDRHEIGTQNPVSPTRLLQAAERLACYMILGGRETVRLRGEPLPKDVSDKIAREEADGIRLSGLSDSPSPADFRFGHRQFAEYLAGRRLARLPTHQAKAFLAGPDGWNSGVAGPLRETAAFAAMFNADIADWIATRDPELIGLSDVADSSLRRAATRALLDRFRRGEMTTAQLRSGVLEFQGLRYDEADADLRRVLRARGDGCDDLLECAIDLARTWKLFSLSDDLADLVLDSAAPMPIRAAAGYALRECGHQSARQRLKPLIAGLPEDQEDELKGVALRCNWPDHLSTPDLLHALTARRRPSLYGAYEGFLLELERDEFVAAGHLPAGLRWAKAQASDLRDSDVMHRIAMRIAQAALHQLDDPAVSSELIPLLRDWARHYMTPSPGCRKLHLNPGRTPKGRIGHRCGPTRIHDAG